MADQIKAPLDTPRRTPDGRTYTLAETIDGIGGLEALNVPHHRPRNVAAAPEGAPDEEEPPTAEELARFDESAADVGARYKVGAATVRGWGRVAPPDVVLALPGGRYRFSGSRLDAWIAAGPNRVNTLEPAATSPNGGVA